MPLSQRQRRLLNCITAVLASFALLMCFQNCAQGEFQTIEGSSELLSSSTGTVIPPDPPPTPMIPIVSLSNPVPATVTVRNVSIQFLVQVQQDLTFKSATCQLDSQAITDCSSKSINYTNLPDGNHQVKIIAVDSANQKSDVLTVPFKVEVPVVVPPPVIPKITLVNPVPTTVKVRNLTIQFAVQVQQGLTFKSASCQLDAQTVTDCSSKSVSYTNLTDGNHQVKITALDSMNQKSDVFSVSFKVEVPVAPPAVIPTVTLATAVPVTISVRNISIQFSVQVQQGLTFKSATCQLDNQAVTDCSSKTVSYSNLADGDHQVKIIAVDSANQKSNVLTVPFKVSVPVANPNGSTYYISPTGSDNNAGTSAAPWGTFAKAWSALKAGDILVLKDGIYKQNLTPPVGKSGTAQAPITIRGENDGMATVDSEGTRSGLNIMGCAYLIFEGFNIGNGTYGSMSIGSSNGKVGGTPSHDNIFRRMGIFGWKNLSGNNVTVGIGGGSHHNLIEDAWIWGNGRYSLMIYGGAGGGNVLDAPYNTIRRVVIRHDPYVSGSGDPQAGLAIYSANNNTVENVIVLDSLHRSNSDNSVFYLTGHAPDTVNNNKLLGSLAINSEGGHLIMDSDLSSGNLFENNVLWGSSKGAGMSLTKTAKNNVYNKITLYGGGFYHAGSTTTLQNSLITKASSFGVKNTGSITLGFNYFYQNSGGDCEGCALNATNNTTQINPGLIYPVRAESNSPLKGTASDSQDRGATVLYRYKDGVVTNEKLWPWPNEARIRSDFCNATTLVNYKRTGADVSAFCTSGKSLTQYVWELGGTTIPAQLYP